RPAPPPALHSFPTRRSSDLLAGAVSLGEPRDLLELIAGDTPHRNDEADPAQRRLLLAEDADVVGRFRPALVDARPLERPPQPSLDRKSTRLNSSHVSISYAV